MGGVKSCFPSPIDKIHTLRRRRHLLTKFKHDQTGSSLPMNKKNNNNNAINLNNACEDELLMLPGITRQLAQNILQYRQLNHGFKQIDELLYITGITNDLFEHIRFDVSIDSSSPHLSDNNQQEIINLNVATYNQLCTIPHLTPILITRIIRRRERKGTFRFVEDLLQIKGIDYVVLASIRSYITVDYRQMPMSVSESSILEPTVNNLYPTLNKNNNNTVTADSLSLASLLLETLPPELQTILLSSPPQRPSSICQNKQTYFRFASWNLQQLTNDKVQNPGVREVICRIILENNFSIIGIQEIGNKEALSYIIEELNNPTIPLIKDWPNRHNGKWKFTISDVSGRMFQSDKSGQTWTKKVKMSGLRALIEDGSEYLGFIYDESVGIEFKKSSLLPFKSYFTRSPYIAIFRIHDKYEFVFVNIHLKARRFDENQNQNERTKDEALSLSILAEAMNDTVEQKHVVISGDFNIAPTASEFDALLQRNYSYVIQQNTNISLKTPQGSTCVDNIWLSAEAKALSTKNSGVIRENLTSMWIPAGWTWGGLVSDHCPIWIEFDLS